jgi:hypothetical protein
MRNILEKTLMNQAVRIYQNNESDLKTLKIEDLPEVENSAVESKFGFRN